MKIFIALILVALCTFQSGAAQAKPRLLAAPQSRDTWRSVRTNNMFVIGNADPEKLRQVAAWLEFFHRSSWRFMTGGSSCGRRSAGPRPSTRSPSPVFV